MDNANKVSVMQSFVDGVMVQRRPIAGGIWQDDSSPSWNWEMYDYRTYKGSKMKIKNFLLDEGIHSATITFGCNAHWNDDGDKKILFDTHIRNACKEIMDIDSKAKFLLVPIDKNSMAIIDKIHKDYQEYLESKKVS